MNSPYFKYSGLPRCVNGLPRKEMRGVAEPPISCDRERGGLSLTTLQHPRLRSSRIPRCGERFISSRAEPFLLCPAQCSEGIIVPCTHRHDEARLSGCCLAPHPKLV